MGIWLGRWGSLIDHVLWRLGMFLPMLFTQYTSEEAVYSERVLSGWKLGVVSVVVLGLSTWSFFM